MALGTSVRSGVKQALSPTFEPTNKSYRVDETYIKVKGQALRTVEISILWDVVAAHLNCKINPNGIEASDDPRVERDSIHGIKPNSGHHTQRGV
jgi:hypothetical protein